MTFTNKSCCICLTIFFGLFLTPTIVFSVLYGLDSQYYIQVDATVNNCSINTEICGDSVICFNVVLKLSYENCNKTLTNSFENPKITPTCQDMKTASVYIDTRYICGSMSFSKINYDENYQIIIGVFAGLSGVVLLSILSIGWYILNSDNSKCNSPCCEE